MLLVQSLFQFLATRLLGIYLFHTDGTLINNRHFTITEYNPIDQNAAINQIMQNQNCNEQASLFQARQ